LEKGSPMKIEMGIDGVFELIIRSIELGKYDNAKAIAQGALDQCREAAAAEPKAEEEVQKA
jgi:hypothetical protein